MTSTTNGFDTNAAYAQLVDAFSAPSGNSSAAPGVLMASNDLSAPGQEPVVSDAGGGDAGMPTLVLPTLRRTLHSTMCPLSHRSSVIHK